MRLLGVLAIIFIFWYALDLPGVRLSGPFPRSVANSCKVSWTEHKGDKFALATIHVLVELKGPKNDLQERALIHLECKGKGNNSLNPKDLRITGTQCSGVRIMLSKKANMLRDYDLFLISPDDIELLSKPEVDPLVLGWERKGADDPGSTFTIQNGNQFTWKMKSRLSGQEYVGTTNCAK